MPILVLILGSGVSGLVYAVQNFIHVGFVEAHRTKGWYASMSGLHLVNDWVITFALLACLRMRTSPEDRHHGVIKTIQWYTLNTGLATSMCALANTIVVSPAFRIKGIYSLNETMKIFAAPNRAIGIAVYANFGRMYTACFLSIVNARQDFRARVARKDEEMANDLHPIETRRRPDPDINVSVDCSRWSLPPPTHTLGSHASLSMDPLPSRGLNYLAPPHHRSTDLSVKSNSNFAQSPSLTSSSTPPALPSIHHWVDHRGANVTLHVDCPSPTTPGTPDTPGTPGTPGTRRPLLPHSASNAMTSIFQSSSSSKEATRFQGPMQLRTAGGVTQTCPGSSYFGHRARQSRTGLPGLGSFNPVD
ncbi:hypothetical protein K488DRAFT_83631 [Vararia minispora EC-137]|uniref:Uncharacterized protein n=1 Tax=Vararia minispora EC-137 TaxID=1314806 RepID=A0ACB8QTB0_9AGAM|nr:hypothetical protein K488DRAFT_83631 [Vararia minispora EC-137]